nr:hypothetical protein Iba_chr15aCG16210 [Ipomoea batatas]
MITARKKFVAAGDDENGEEKLRRDLRLKEEIFLKFQDFYIRIGEENVRCGWGLQQRRGETPTGSKAQRSISSTTHLSFFLSLKGEFSKISRFLYKDRRGENPLQLGMMAKVRRNSDGIKRSKDVLIVIPRVCKSWQKSCDGVSSKETFELIADKTRTHDSLNALDSNHDNHASISNTMPK